MAFIKQWEEELARIQRSDLENMLEALDTLSNWPMFMAEFQGTQIQLFTPMLKAEIAKRVWRWPTCGEGTNQGPTSCSYCWS